jgi:hypothetical protein
MTPTKILSLTLLFFLIPSVCFCQDLKIWPNPNTEADTSSIVGVETDRARGTGSIIFVNPDETHGDKQLAHILTAFHVINYALETEVDDEDYVKEQEDEKVKVVFREGTPSYCKILAINSEMDIAILSAYVPKDLKPYKIAKRGLRPQEKLTIMGLGGDRDPKNLFENIRCFDDIAAPACNKNWVLSDCVVIPGDSGGPIFNEDMEIVGVVMCGWERFIDFYELYEDDPKQQTIFGEADYPMVWPTRGPSVYHINRLLESIKSEKA